MVANPGGPSLLREDSRRNQNAPPAISAVLMEYARKEHFSRSAWHVMRIKDEKALLLSQQELMYLTGLRYRVKANCHM